MITALLSLLAALAFIIYGTSKLKWPAFLVLLLASLFLALATGVDPQEIGPLLSEGFGKTVKSIGLLIVFGSIIGVALEQSGATKRIAISMLSRLSFLPLPYTVAIIGYLVSIPVFCDSAFVILSSLNKRLSQKSGVPLLALTIALSTGLFATHVLIPPTPGPLAAAANLELNDLGLLIIMGGSVAFLLMLVGAAFAQRVSKRVSLEIQLPETEEENVEELPSLKLAIAPILIPLLLIGLSSFSNHFKIDPTLALGVGMVLSFRLGRFTKTESFLSEVVNKGIQTAAPILLITAMGGTLGLVISKLPVAEFVAEHLLYPELGLLIPFLIAALLKSAQGSSTVAIITASAMVFPMLATLGLDSDLGKTWVVIAVGIGSMTVSHANDSYFWIVSQFGNLSVKEAYRYHTFATLLQGIAGLIIVIAGYLISSTLNLL
ncbi:MAG: DsdX permease [Flavobacteriaceae bacterium]|jgi:GntP family gluconate:H+ symporter|nr:MAG: DsdX permease [Flavobacteriaceae bacterium]